ncbi:MAG: zinc ABC transporter substrate-binding protein [Planctomycetaceae bacterium]
MIQPSGAVFPRSSGHQNGLKVFLLLFSGFGLACLSGCWESPSAHSSSPRVFRNILCTTGMAGDMVAEVAGPDVSVQVLMGPGVDPHLFSPSPQDVEKMALADAIVYSGLHLEAGLSAYLERLSRKNPHVYALADGIADRDQLIRVAHELYDPHFWNDLELWQAAALSLGEKLAEWNPEQATGYQSRAAAYAARLAELQEWGRSEIARIPESRRILITAHDAFGYLGRSLNIEVEAVQGISTNTEASIRTIEDLVEAIVTRQIPAIFSESSVSDKSVRAIIDGCQRRGHDLKLGGVLYSDALGPPGSGAETFVGMYRSNVNAMVSGLSD